MTFQDQQKRKPKRKEENKMKIVSSYVKSGGAFAKAKLIHSVMGQHKGRSILKNFGSKAEAERYIKKLKRS